MKRQVFIVGRGKLAQELLQELDPGESFEVLPWPEPAAAPSQAIVIHAGSGKALPQLFAYCAATGSTLIELATGTDLGTPDERFPLLLCPNTNILMLKFMHMLAQCGASFHGYTHQLIESHQANKSSTPGTAVSMAHALGIPENAIQSVRDPRVQQHELGIPEEHLARHAFHRIVIADEICSLKLESQVYGAAPYAAGVAKIVAGVHAHPLESRRYEVQELVAQGWI